MLVFFLLLQKANIMFKRQISKIIKTDSNLICVSTVRPQHLLASDLIDSLTMSLKDCYGKTYIDEAVITQEFDLFPYVVFAHIETLKWSNFTAQVDQMIELGGIVIILTDKPLRKALKCFKHHLAQQPLLIEV